MNTKKIFVAALAVVALASCSKPAGVDYSSEAALVTSIKTSITATGTIEPVTEVTVGTQVSGIIDKIFVDYNSVVHKGQVIAELDKTNLLSELASAQSNLSNAEADLTYQKANFQRYKTLFDKGLVSSNDYENAKLSYDKALQTVRVQKNNVSKAQTNLGYATITSPIDGVILSKKVEEGQTVAAAMSTPELFVIAQDLTDMRVIANIDEADIGGVKEGQRVEFAVDAFPDDVFKGTVTQVRQEATTTSNVVTYEVVISAPNNDLKLKPGLTANITIFTQEKDNVMAVPSKALRFAPNEDLLQEGQTIQDVDAPAKVWTLEGSVFKAHAVAVGVSNGTLTEVSGIAEGTKVLTDISVAGVEDEEKAQGNPFMPRRPQKKDAKGEKGSK